MRLSSKDAVAVASKLRYTHDGLIPVVVQDVTTKDVLMVAFANREAVKNSLTRGRMHFWSRERRKLWEKGETSGHYQYLSELDVDCDQDVLVAKVEQVVGACHKGYRSCFFRKVNGSKFVNFGVRKWKT